MGPFSANSYLVKTIAYNRSRPTTSTSIRIPFSLLSQGIQVMRQSGITVTAVTNIYTDEAIKNTDLEKPITSKASTAKRAPQANSSKKDDLRSTPQKEKKVPTRRGRKKN